MRNKDIFEGKIIYMGGVRELRHNKDKDMRKRFDIVKKYYKIVYPLQCDNCQKFIPMIYEKNIPVLELILDWIEYQQTRNDIFL